jgi:proteasome lid subunit RPN8/RPN11
MIYLFELRRRNKMGAIITTKAYRKMEDYARAVKTGEIGGLILGKINSYGDIVVKDAIILKQIKNSSHFEIEEDAMMEFTKNADERQVASVLGWWHSHGRYGAFWSSDDSKCFERLCNLSNQCFGIVVSTKNKEVLDLRCRLDILNKENSYISIDEIAPLVDMFKHKPTTISSTILADIQNNVIDGGDEEFIECSKCGGTGIVSQTYFGKLLGHKSKKVQYVQEDYKYPDDDWGDDFKGYY